MARRRAVQLEAALTQARALLAQGQLESALDACQQALTYDENHVGALRLEEEIEAALRGGATAAQNSASPENVETLWPNLDVRQSEAMTQLDPASGAPPSGAMERTVLRLPIATPEATVIAPSRRTPPPAASPAPVAKAASAPVAKQQGKTSRPVQKKPSPIGPIVADIVARSKSVIDSVIVAVRPGVVALSRDRRALGIVAIAAGVVVIAVVAIMMFSGPAPTGTVLIDATPFGTITAIETDGGDAVALPPSPSTPLSLTLPEGTYVVVVAGPPPESQTQRVTIQIQRDTPTEVAPIRFRALTAGRVLRAVPGGAACSAS